MNVAECGVLYYAAQLELVISWHRQSLIALPNPLELIILLPCVMPIMGVREK